MEKGKYIGYFVNKWRQRTVAVFEHPTDPDLIVSVGRPFDGSDPIECEEKRKDWSATLRRIADYTAQGKVYIYE